MEWMDCNKVVRKILDKDGVENFEIILSFKPYSHFNKIWINTLYSYGTFDEIRYVIEFYH